MTHVTDGKGLYQVGTGHAGVGVVVAEEDCSNWDRACRGVGGLHLRPYSICSAQNRFSFFPHSGIKVVSPQYHFFIHGHCVCSVSGLLKRGGRFYGFIHSRYTTGTGGVETYPF